MLLLYKGTSWISKLIKWQTWSDFSHAAWWCQDGTVIEAWHKKTLNGKLKMTLKGGVQRHDSPATIHTTGTEIQCFSIPGIDEAAVEQFLISQIGKDYDFAPVLRGFTFRVKRDNPDKWFCSELIFAACQAAGVNLLRELPAWKVSPGLLSCSPLLEPVGTLITRDNVDFDFQSVEAASLPLNHSADASAAFSPPAPSDLSSDLRPPSSGGAAE